jgi:hypothetical protein
MVFFLPGVMAAAAPLPAQEKAPFDREKAEISQLGLPSPYDKFLGLDQVLHLTYGDWKAIYGDVEQDVDAAELKNESDMALALGVKIADGVMAIKARDVESLNDCAGQIETLAKKLGVKDEEMSRAKTVRAHANKGEWMQVFLELGFLQSDIMNSLRSQGNAQRRPLIIAGGWVQGLQYTSLVVSKHYTAETSNFLREPTLVKSMQAELNALPAEVKGSPKVTALISEMAEIYSLVNIPLDGTVSQDGVKKLQDISKRAVAEMTQP